MGFLKSKLGWGLSAAYLLISVILTLSLGLFGESFITLILGLPWTLPLAQFEFFDISSLFLAYVAALAPIVLNAIILYIIGYLLERGRARQAALLVLVIVLGGCSYYLVVRSSVDQSQDISPESGAPVSGTAPNSDSNRHPIFNPDAAARTSGYVFTHTDLNGDGVEEKISLNTWTAESAGTSELMIGDTATAVPGWNPRGYFGIVDIDMADKFKEVAVSDDGPSSDYTTSFYRYDGKNVVFLGTISGIYEDMEFGAQGSLITRSRGKILETWFYLDEYKLSPGLKLVRVAKDFYNRLSSDPVMVLVSLPLQRSPSDPTIVATLSKGERVKILGCDDIAWCQVENSRGLKGWFAIKDYDLVTAVNLHAPEVFEGLSNAD